MGVTVFITKHPFFHKCLACAIKIICFVIKKKLKMCKFQTTFTTTLQN